MSVAQELFDKLMEDGYLVIPDQTMVEMSAEDEAELKQLVDGWRLETNGHLLTGYSVETRDTFIQLKAHGDYRL